MILDFPAGLNMFGDKEEGWKLSWTSKYSDSDEFLLIRFSFKSSEALFIMHFWNEYKIEFNFQLYNNNNLIKSKLSR